VNGIKPLFKISIIVPVYNSETYLKAYLESIINQTLKEIEIIILNDGSTDKSESIIKKYQQKDKRIKYYYHKNIDRGLTRNKGISISKGEYIAFVDSDDYISLDMMEKMYDKAIAEKLDVICGKVYIKEEDNMYIRQKHIKGQTIDIKEKGIEYFLRQYFFTKIYRNSLWDKIYKREFIIENQIFCGDNSVFAEDLYFQFKLILQLPTVGFLNELMYYHIQRADSIMHSEKKDVILKHLNMLEHFHQLNKIKWDIYVNIKFNQIRKQFIILYNIPIYKKFLVSVKKNHSYKLYKNRKTRVLFFVFYILQRAHLKILAELLLYIKQYIAIKKNNR